MNCRSCMRPIPEHAKMCHHCYKRTGYSLHERKFPSSDMYGAPICEIKENSAKAHIRNQYLDTLPEYIEHKKGQKNNIKKILFLVLGMFIVIPLLIIPTLLFVFIATQAPALGIPLLVLFFIGFIVACTIVFVKVIKSMKPAEQLEKQLKVHSNKHRFYTNNYVFGFSVLDHATHNDNGTDYYYAFYEIDKRNIRGFTYDSRYGEYIILTYNPTYMHYDLPPTNEFRIPDIFDDDVLPKIFGCDMPPKNVPF